MPRVFLTDKSERTYLSIMDAAVQLFQTKGFEGTSMRDIARESGLALGAIYYYCRSKEELVLLFYDRINRQINASYAQKVTAPRNLGDAFRNKCA